MGIRVLKGGMMTTVQDLEEQDTRVRDLVYPSYGCSFF